MSNSIFAAMLLTAIAVVIILGMYYDELRGGGRKKMTRMVIYLFVGMLVVVFIHHYAMTTAISGDMAQKGVRDVFQGVAQSQQINPTNISTITGRGEGVPAERPDNVGDADNVDDVEPSKEGLIIEPIDARLGAK
jgi:hypothetical protein